MPKTMTLCAGFGCSEHVCHKCWDAHIDLHRLAHMEISEEYDIAVRRSWRAHDSQLDLEMLSAILKQGSKFLGG